MPKVAGDIPGQCGYITFINIDKQRALVYGGVTKERRRVSDVYILDMYDWVSEHYLQSVNCRNVFISMLA